MTSRRDFERTITSNQMPSGKLQVCPERILKEVVVVVAEVVVVVAPGVVLATVAKWRNSLQAPFSGCMRAQTLSIAPQDLSQSPSHLLVCV